MLTLYDSDISGNCYKVRLILAHLGLEYERVAVDVDAPERPAAVAAKNPWGRVPVLDLGDGRALAESNAILTYLAQGTPYLPEDPFRRAQVFQWMFFEQNAHEPTIAVVRHKLMIGRDDDPTIEDKRRVGRAVLAVMDRQLTDREFFVDGGYTIADIALYAYTHVAPEAGLPLEPYPAIRGWIDRVWQQRGHVPML